MRNVLKPVLLGFFSIMLITTAHLGFAQQKKKKAPVSKRDSLAQEMRKRKSLIRSFKQSDGSINDFLGKIEDYNAKYVETNGDLEDGFDTLEISQRLPTMERRMAVMKSAINKSNTLVYLVTIRDMVDHVMQQTDSWQNDLNKYNDRLDKIRADINAFENDSSLDTLPQDSDLRAKCLLQLDFLYDKWDALDVAAKKATIKIGALANRVSSLAILMIDMDDRVDAKLHQFTVNAVGDEYGYIWDMEPVGPEGRLNSAFKASYTINSKLYKYFFIGKSNYYPHIGSVLLLIVFFTWIYASKRKINRESNQSKTILKQTHFIVKHPFATTIAIVVLISPYFYDHPAQVYLQTMLLVMILAAGVLIKNNWPKPAYYFWLLLFVFAALYSISDLMIVVTHADRWLLLAISVIAIYAAIRFLKQVNKNTDDYPLYLSLIIKLFIALQAASILLNVCGRFSLAKIAGATSVFSLCTAMGFYLFVQILMEALFLQLEANKSEDNQTESSFLDFKELQKKFKDVLMKVALVLWLISLAKNLVVDDYIYDQASEFLSHPYKFSSTAFTFGSVLIFMIVIWISGLVARVISYFYDFTGQQTKLTPQAKKTRSSILLIRLTIFVIGFFIAIAASGIPMDRVTIVIGALGVGIGFGLQNIVNNLVSGVILAFEKPVQVGDIIEVSGKSGTIKEIGIRSSKIDCGDGSELIVPNGDLISQHVVNWTLSNNNRRIELFISVAYGSDIVKVEELLKKIIEAREDVMSNPAPAIYLNKFAENAIDFRALFWTPEIGKWQSLKSSVMNEIYMTFAKEGIEIPLPKGDIKVIFPDGVNPMEKPKSLPGGIPEPPAKTE